MKYYWIIPVLSLAILTWLWYPTTVPVIDETIIQQDTIAIPSESIDTVYFFVEEPRYIQHIEPAPTFFDWSREIMTFVLGIGNIILLVRRKNAAN